MNPQNNSTPINIGNRKMFWIWLALIGGFVIIILLIAIFLYQSKTKSTINQPTIIKKSVEQKAEITPADENIDQEVDSLDLGNMDSDFQDVEKDINQL